MAHTPRSHFRSSRLLHLHSQNTTKTQGLTEKLNPNSHQQVSHEARVSQSGHSRPDLQESELGDEGLDVFWNGINNGLFSLLQNQITNYSLRRPTTVMFWFSSISNRLSIKGGLNNSIKKGAFFVGQVDGRNETVTRMWYKSGTASEHSMAALLGTSSSCYFTLSGGCWANYSATPQQFLTKQAVCRSPVLSPLTLKVDRP